MAMNPTGNPYPSVVTRKLKLPVWEHPANGCTAYGRLAWVKLLVLCLVLATSLPAFAALTATVDRTEISDADLLVLNVQLQNSSSGVEPDFDILERDFEIVSNSGAQRTSRISITNGTRRSEVYVRWQLTLRARRLGNLVIPALISGNERSAPMTVNVTKQTAAMQRRTSQYVFFDTTVDVNETYVQGQVLYTVKLFYSEAISGDFPAPPVLPDAVVETIEGEKRYDSIINNRRYYVLEKRYGIYPQKSGELTIPRETFAGTRSRSNVFAAGDRVMAVSKPIMLNIKPKPSSYPDANWLPAKRLRLTEAWSQTPPAFKVGEPINRTLTLMVEGVAGSLLPPLDSFDVEGAKTYIDPPALDEVATDSGIVATQVYTIGIVPTQAGTMTLPAISLPWWNTETDRLEVAKIAASSFVVATNIVATKPNPGIVTVPQTPIVASSDTLPEQKPSPWISIAIALAVLFALLWLITLVMWWRSRQRLTAPAALSITTSAIPMAQDAKALFQQLTQACQNNDALTARRSLSLWGKQQYPKVNSNHELALALDYSALTDEIAELERCIYAVNAQQIWQGAALITALKDRLAQNNNTKNKTMLLAEMNPSA
jgi:hypothetical protein